LLFHLNTCSFGGDDKGLLQRYSSGFDLLHAEPDSDSDLPSKITSRFNFTERERDLDRHVAFDIRGDDVMVFLHIQKTGGTTFGRHLVKNIQLERPCDCVPGQRKCTCHRPGKAESWLFSRFSTGWSCGLHADWTELTSCVPLVMNKRDKKTSSHSMLQFTSAGFRNMQLLTNTSTFTNSTPRNFYYITMLRDPVSRYLSEWKHVQRGATWKTAIHMCDGRPPTQDELPACYSGEDWTGVPLADFMNCPSNLANNRQHVLTIKNLKSSCCVPTSSNIHTDTDTLTRPPPPPPLPSSQEREGCRPERQAVRAGFSALTSHTGNIGISTIRPLITGSSLPN
uniref:Heparan-sulfate 6-O-sulfotransferase n=1 Tax=Echeneis naucrates TaxID=173247 RepID=A0A665WBH3_ECHNA